METVRDIRRRARRDLQRRIFRSGIFRRQHMKDMARSLAQEHSAGMPPEKLLALARHDTWLKQSYSGDSDSHYPGAKTERIAEELRSYLRSELRVLVDTFWEGRTSVEFIAQSDSVELDGFFNGRHPGRQDAAHSLRDDAHSRKQFPYA